MTSPARLSTGIAGLDELLGGGLIPGTLTAVVGATGIGKTQLGLQFLNAGLAQEGRRGIIFDMTARGDSQSHELYAQRMFDWQPQPAPRQRIELEGFFGDDRRHGEYLQVFDVQGRRVTRRDLDFDQWRDWQAELMKKLGVTIGFFYGNFVQGARRAVIDGLEPVGRQSDSIQFELFEYVYHQILRKDPEWIARDLFREHYRAHADDVARNVYDPGRIGALLLYTSPEVMLEDMLAKPLDEGDLLAAANTIIYLGKTRREGGFGRGLFVAKHRGSRCPDDIIEYEITDAGLKLKAS